MSVPTFLLKFAVRKVLGTLFNGDAKAKSAVDYDKTGELDKFTNKPVELSKVPKTEFNKDDYNSRVDSLFVKGESTNLAEALEETTKLNVDLVSDLSKNVDSKIEALNENIGKVKDITETSSSIANLSLQTALSQSVSRSSKEDSSPGLLSSILSGIGKLLNGISEAIIGAIGLSIESISEKVKDVYELVKYQGASNGSVKKAPGASEETTAARDEALKKAQEDEDKKNEEFNSYMKAREALPFVAVDYIDKIKASDWLNNYYETYGVSDSERVKPSSEAEAIREISRLQQTNSGLFSAVDFNQEVINEMSDSDLENYWNSYSFDSTQAVKDVHDIDAKWEGTQKRDANFYKLTNTQADAESRIKFDSLLSDFHNYFKDNGVISEQALSSSLIKGVYPVALSKSIRAKVSEYAKELKDTVVNDPNLLKIFTGDEIGLDVNDSELKFLGKAIKYSSKEGYSNTVESGKNLFGTYKMSLTEQAEASKPIVTGDAFIFDKRGNVVTNYGFLNDGSLSAADVSNYEVLSENPNPTLDKLGTDVNFNPTKENLQLLLEQFMSRNEELKNSGVDATQIMNYIENNDGKLDTYLKLMTDAVSLGFGSVAGLITKMVNESRVDAIVLPSSSTD